MAAEARHRLREQQPEEDVTVANLPYIEEAERLVEETAVSARELPSREELRLVSRRSDRNRTVTIAVVALIATLALGFSAWNDQRIDRTAADTVANQQAVEAVNRSISELRAAGVPENELPPPVVAEPGQSVDVNAIIAATTATILAKIRTDPQFRGTAGLNGLEGPLGPIGPMGPAGPRGEQGERGLQGEEGDEGPQGPAGPQGAAGEQGPAGPQGAQGQQGDKGGQGDQGPEGPAGPTGPEGPAGPPGVPLLRGPF